MGGLFSKRRNSTSQPPPKISPQDMAILQLKTQRDKIKQYVRRKEKSMDREREIAKRLIHEGKKDRALLLLKKKKYQESIIDRTLKQLDQIDRMVHDLEFAEIEQRVVEGLKMGNEALKKMNEMFSVDDVEKILEETREAAEYQDEISSILSGQLTDSDMADVESELEAMLESEAEELKLPDVPTAEIAEPVAHADRPKHAERPEKKPKKQQAEAVMLEAS